MALRDTEHGGDGLVVGQHDPGGLFNHNEYDTVMLHALDLRALLRQGEVDAPRGYFSR